MRKALKKILISFISFSFVFTSSPLINNSSDKETPINQKAASRTASLDLKMAFAPFKGLFEFKNESSIVYKSGDIINTSITPIKGFGVDLAEKLRVYGNVSFSYIYAESFEDIDTFALGDGLDVKADNSIVRIPPPLDKDLANFSFTDISLFDTYFTIMSLGSRDDLYFNDTANFSTLKLGILKDSYLNNSKAKEYVDSLYQS